MTDLIVDAIECQFSSRMVTETDKSTAAVAIELLLQFLQDIKKHATTVAEVLNLLKCAIHSMKSSCHCNAALESACDAFYWHVTRFTSDPSSESWTLEEIMCQLVKYGQQYHTALQQARNKVALQGKNLIRNNSTILVHSKSRCVFEMIKCAMECTSKRRKRFNVVVTQSAIDSQRSSEMAQQISLLGLQCRLIPEAAVGFEMEKVDAVYVGAESVCQSGGIVNRLGTMTIALCARAMNKPFYVFAESFKFTRGLFPLSNADIHEKWTKNKDSEVEDRSESPKVVYPQFDYTEPNLITYVVSDLGIMTPATVCEQLLRLYE